MSKEVCIWTFPLTFLISNNSSRVFLVVPYNILPDTLRALHHCFLDKIFLNFNARSFTYLWVAFKTTFVLAPCSHWFSHERRAPFSHGLAGGSTFNVCLPRTESYFVKAGFPFWRCFLPFSRFVQHFCRFSFLLYRHYIFFSLIFFHPTPRGSSKKYDLKIRVCKRNTPLS